MPIIGIEKRKIGDEVSVQFVRNGTSYETKLRLKEDILSHLGPKVACT